MKRIFIVGVVIVIVLLFNISWATNAEKEKAAVRAAESWLTLIDMGEYSKSWQEAAEYFRDSVEHDQWGKMLQSIRTPLGKVISRKLKTKTYKTSLPGTPDGQYVIVQFETSSRTRNLPSRPLRPCLTRTVGGEYPAIT